METGKISKRAFDMIKAHEGLPTRVINGVRMAVPYRDPIGIPTIGVGFIRLHGRPVTMSTLPMTLEEVDNEFMKQLQTYINGVQDATEFDLSPDQLGALASFAYNLGVRSYQTSTLRKRINARDFEDVGYQFSRWNRAGGRVWSGLTKRRKEEAELFLHGTRPCITCGKL